MRIVQVITGRTQSYTKETLVTLGHESIRMALLRML